MRQSWLWPICLVLAALVAGLVVFALPGTTLRPFVIFGFLFFCPGMAVVRFFRLNYIVAELTLAVAISLSLGAIIAGIFMYSGHWSLSGILITMLVISVVGATGQLVILHPAIAQRLDSLSIFKIPEDIAAGATMALPRIASARGATNANISDQQTAFLPSYKPTPNTDQEKDVAETNTVQMPAVASDAPAQEAIADRETMRMNVLEHVDADAAPEIADESQSKSEAIEKKDTALVPKVRIYSSPTPRLKSIRRIRPLREEEEAQQKADSSAVQEEDVIDKKETARIPSPTLDELIKEQNIGHVPGVSSSSADQKQAIEEKETISIPATPSPASVGEEQLIEEKETSNILPSPSPVDEKQLFEEKETVNIPLIQPAEPELIPAQTSQPSPDPEAEQDEKDPEEQEEREPEEQKKKEPVTIAAKRAQTPSGRAIIPLTNPHKAIIQEPATKSVLRKRRLTKEVVKQEVSEQDAF